MYGVYKSINKHDRHLPNHTKKTFAVMPTASKYHVLCDRGFAPRVLAWCLFFFLVILATPLTALGRAAFEAAKVHVMARAHAWQWWSVISLLASSCCAVQVCVPRPPPRFLSSRLVSSRRLSLSLSPSISCSSGSTCSAWAARA